MTQDDVTDKTNFLPVKPKPGTTVCVVLLDGVEIARADYDRDLSIIQCKRGGVPKGIATMLRRIARELSSK